MPKEYVGQSDTQVAVRWGREPNVAIAVLDRSTCSCRGARWVDDQNWQPEGPAQRTPGNGLIPCGLCNEGGWDTPIGAAVEPEGLWTSLTRDGCNDLIRLIRRARDAAYGPDA